MADSDRSRSPVPARNRLEPPGRRQPLPCFPRWCGPMGSAVRTLHNMPRPQHQPKWPGTPSGLCMMGRMWPSTPPALPTSWAASQQFPPTPANMPPPPTIPFHTLKHYNASSNTTVLSNSSHVHLSITTTFNQLATITAFCPNRTRTRPPESMASIWMNTVNPIGITTTTRRSTAWHFQGPFASRLSLRSWTSKDVTFVLASGGCALSAGQQPLASKAGSWSRIYLIPTGDIAAVVFATELLTQLRNRGIDLDRVSQTGLDKMGRCWIRLPTQSMQRNSLRSRSTSKAGFLLGQWIRIPSMRSQISAINWLSFVNGWAMTHKTSHRHHALANLARPLSPRPSNVRWWETLQPHLHQPSIRHVSSRSHPPPTCGLRTICPQAWPIEPSPSGWKNSHCPTSKEQFLRQTPPKRKLGGESNLLRPSKPSRK